MFIDEITLNIHAGKGGDGIVSWKHEKGLDHAGPGGGDGGNGGNVWLKGVNDINHLSLYKFIKDFKAEDGQNGQKNCMHGKNGDDVTITFPIGTVVHNLQSKDETEVLNEEPILFLKGGRGGYGNAHFKGPENRRPKEKTLGKIGEGGEFFIELKLVADIGLVGLPNAGKSSLLNALTGAKAKVGNFQFTTLSPNLGVLGGFVLADIPGLIEGASKGKGLGDKFLRHISRTKMILHCLSAEEEDPIRSYNIAREEMSLYDKSIAEKPEVIVLTKTDLTDRETLKAHIKVLKKLNPNIFEVSVLDKNSLSSLNDKLTEILKKL